MGIVVHSAGIQDRDGAKLVLLQVLSQWTRLQFIWADGAYGGKLQDWAWMAGGWFLAIVKRNQDTKGWQVLPHRWIVERTIAWLSRYRRMSKDDEGRTDVSEAMIRVAMIHLMVRRLAPKAGGKSERSRRNKPTDSGRTGQQRRALAACG